MGRRSTCETAREWASVRLDGMLSEFELRLLDAHLGRCAECRPFAESVAALTAALRAVPPVPYPIRPPAASRWRTYAEHLPAFRRRGPRLSDVTVATVAAAAGAALALLPLHGQVHQPAGIERPAVVVDATAVEGAADQRAFLTQFRDHQNAQRALESQLATVRTLGADDR